MEPVKDVQGMKIIGIDNGYPLSFPPENTSEETEPGAIKEDWP